MANNLTGAVVNSKGDLLHISNSGSGISASFQTVYDGLGNATGCKISNLGYQAGNIQLTSATIALASGSTLTITPNTTFSGDVTISGTTTFSGSIVGMTISNPFSVGSFTVTLGGNFTTSGSYNTTFTLTGNTNVTLPTSGTLCTTVGSSSITTVGTISSGTWQGTAIDLTTYATGTLAANKGGSGRTSHTAYAVICGGTTSTGAQQSIASVGTSGQVLTSNGAGALPTFQTPITPSLVLIQSQTASASSTLDFATGITSSYKGFKFILTNVAPATDGVNLLFRAGTSSGYLASSQYSYANTYTDTSGTVSGTGGTGASYARLSGVCGNDAFENVSGEFTVCFTTADIIHITGTFTYRTTTGGFLRVSTGAEVLSASIDRFRFLFSSGNIASGTISLFGIS